MFAPRITLLLIHYLLLITYYSSSGGGGIKYNESEYHMYTQSIDKFNHTGWGD